MQRFIFFIREMLNHVNFHIFEMFDYFVVCKFWFYDIVMFNYSANDQTGIETFYNL